MTAWLQVTLTKQESLLLIKTESFVEYLFTLYGDVLL